MMNVRKLSHFFLFLCLWLFLPYNYVFSASRECRFSIRKETIHCKQLPDHAKRATLVFVSDLHLTKDNIRSSKMQDLVRKINECKPDWLVIGGDLFDFTPYLDFQTALWDTFKPWAKKLQVSKQIYVIPGNHDPAIQRSKEAKAMFREVGMEPLVNEIRDTGGPIIAGFRQQTWDKDDVDPDFLAQLEKIPRDRTLILVCHRPDVIKRLPSRWDALILSGHTHGGLISLPGIKNGCIAGMFADDNTTKEYPYGWYQRGSLRLLVSSGIGGEGKSGIRIGMSPEIVVFQLIVP